jgi:hypothetical protein
MAGAISTRARYPTRERRSLVYWTGDKGGPSLSLVDLEVTTAIALSLANASRNQALIDDARGQGLGVMLDGEAWRGQLAPGHRMRKSWRPAGLEGDERIHPDQALFAQEWRLAFTEQFIDAQVLAGGTLLTTAGHFSEEPLGTARQNDFALARDAIAYVDQRRLREPGPGDDDPLPRRLLATITITPRILTGEAVERLIEGYAPLDADGFMIWAFEFGGSQRQFKLLRELALGLELASGKPTIVGGLGQLWKLTLASGVSAVCFGNQRAKLDWPPPDAEKPKEGEEPKGRGVAIYHRRGLGGFLIGKRGEAQRDHAFRDWPCRCGHHPENKPPQTRAEALAHNVAMTMVEARDAVVGEPAEALARLLARATSAAEFRAGLGMGSLDSAWRLTFEDFPDLAEPGLEQIG